MAFLGYLASFHLWLDLEPLSDEPVWWCSVLSTVHQAYSEYWQVYCSGWACSHLGNTLSWCHFTLTLGLRQKWIIHYLLGSSKGARWVTTFTAISCARSQPNWQTPLIFLARAQLNPFEWQIIFVFTPDNLYVSVGQNSAWCWLGLNFLIARQSLSARFKESCSDNDQLVTLVFRSQTCHSSFCNIWHCVCTVLHLCIFWQLKLNQKSSCG